MDNKHSIRVKWDPDFSCN